jgi:hypothetical protein
MANVRQCMVKYVAMVPTICVLGVAQQLTVSLTSASAPAGTSASLNVQVAASAGFAPASLEWTVNAPASEVQSITTTAGAVATAASKVISCSGHTCLVYGLNSNAMANGTVAVINVQLASSATGNLAVQLSNVSAASPQASGVPATTIDGEISVTAATSNHSVAIVYNTQINCFTAYVQGATNQKTTWTMNPNIGTLRISAMYTGLTPFGVNGSGTPAETDTACYVPGESSGSISSITLMATSAVDPTASAIVIIDPQTGAPK